MRRDRLFIAIFGIVAIVFAVGAFRLLSMRFESGDVYQPYSSFRTDPLGTKAYYEALENLPGMSVSRNVRPAARISGGDGTTLIFAGVDAGPTFGLDRKGVGAIDSFVRKGGRLAVLTYPERSGRFRPDRRVEDRAEKTGPDAGKEDRAGEDGKKEERASEEEGKSISAESGEKARTAAARWGFRFDIRERKKPEDGAERKKRTPLKALLAAPGEGTLPEQISWHSDVVLRDLDEAWRVLYTVDGDAVMIERNLGSGTVVIATDPYFLSNEAVVRERHPALLAWLSGTGSTVVFDESTHGVQETPGVATLVRKYRLGGLVAVFLLLSGLFVWKNASSLVPPRGREHGNIRDDSLEGRDYLAGLSGLLRRSIPPSRVIQVCVDQWRTTARYRRKDFGDDAAAVQKIVASARERVHPVAQYREITKILRERNHR